MDPMGKIFAYICDIRLKKCLLFPTLESNHWDKLHGFLLECGYHFKKQRIVREGGEWVTYDKKTQSAYDVVPMLILGQRLNLADLFACILVVLGCKCMYPP